ncbi:MAG: leucine-rich repeat domain-containing protein, partial [Faecalibacterium sp.]|nr:leucine-rich repeat domain-containing protein [Ruminococcus sp.]MCM1485405.1 leucine-rich repeat domain-containing protein [Faecalibacterium sp.]
MKKFLSVFLAVLMLFCIVPTSAFAAEDYGNVIASGICGAEPNPDSVTWTRYDSGTLVFSGSGAMRDYDYSNNNGLYQNDREYCQYTKVPYENLSSCYDYKYAEIDTKKVVIQSGITHIANCAFQSFINLTSVEMTDTIITIGEYSFIDCDALESIILPYGIEEIGNSSFAECEKLINVKLPSTLKIIDDQAFSECRCLKDIKLPESLETIGFYAFSKTALSNLYIPANVSFIGTFPVMSINFKAYSVDEKNEYYCTDEFGVLFTKDMKTLVSFPPTSNLTTYEIPNGVETIDLYAFAINLKLETVTMPNSVRTIDSLAFGFCHSLKDVVLSESLETIGGNAFVGCYHLENISIPSSTKFIGIGAFGACYKLAKIPINSIDALFEEQCIGYQGIQPIDGVSIDEIIERYTEIDIESYFGDSDKAEILSKECDKLVVEIPIDATKDTCTIYCHSGSTAETYAIENKVSYETVHF